MAKKQQKEQHSTIYIFTWIMFIFSAFGVIYSIWEMDISFLSAIFTFAKDSSGFLTFLCIVMIAMLLLRNPRQYTTAILNVISIVLLNRLYLNSQWMTLYNSIKEYLSERNWSNIIFLGALIAAVGYCIYVGWKAHRKDSFQTENDIPDLSANPPINIAASITGEKMPDSVSEQPSAESSNSIGVNVSAEYIKPEQNSPVKTNPVIPALLITCLMVIFFFIIEVAVYDVWKLAHPLEAQSMIGNTLPILAILSAAFIFSFITYKAVSSFGNIFHSQNIRVTALFAIFIEIGIITVAIINDGQFSSNFLNEFINAIVDNSLIALPLILVTMFIILDIFISVIAKLIFGKDSHKWIHMTEQRIALIEQGLTVFVCNLMIGFINLLLFIPDFFNHIGQLLLDESDFFPQEKIQVEDLTSDKKEFSPKETPSASADSVENEEDTNEG